MNLTPKQEQFCKNIAKGMNNADAYRNSHNTKTKNYNTVYRAANELLNTPKVAARIKELKSRIDEKFIYTTAQSFENLLKVQDLALSRQNSLTGKPSPDLKSFLSAEELKGKLAGLYVDHKEMTINGTSNVTFEVVDAQEHKD